MNEKIKRLREQAASLLHEITVRRDSFDEDMTANQRSEWLDEQTAELKTILDRYNSLESQIATEERIAQVTSDLTTSRGLEIMGNNENAGLNGGSGGNDEQAYARAFGQWIRTGIGPDGQYSERWTVPIHSVDSLTSDDRFKNSRALAVGAAPGLNAIRDESAIAFVVAQYENDSLREAGATVRSTATGSPWPLTTFFDEDGSDNFNMAPIVAEGAASAEQDPVTGRPVMNAYTYRGHVDVSMELDQDDVVGLMAELPNAAGGRLSRGRAAHHTTGTGSGQPQGVVTGVLAAGTGARVTTTRAVATADATGWTTLIDLYNKPGRAYRRNGRWMMNTDIFTTYLKMKDGDGRPLFIPDVRSDLMVGPFNRQVVVNDDMPALAAANSPSVLALYGDFSYYWIRDVRAVEFRRDISIKSEDGEIRLYYSVRGDGRLIDPGNHPIAMLRTSN